ncbi:MAG: nodulation protein NfeD [Candidatus Omnitrophota bacterium]
MQAKLKYIFLIPLIAFLYYNAAGQEARAADKGRGEVYVVPVKGIIDLGLSGFIRRALNEAREENAAAIILDIDTFGGRVDAAVEICDALEEIKPIPTFAFVDDQAWSAGALIALATDEIIMSPGSSIGSAEPRTIGPGGAKKKDELTDEKMVSAIRAKFKSVAEQNNHPAGLALAMVDKDIVIHLAEIKGEKKILDEKQLEEARARLKRRKIKIIKTISAQGKLLNLTAKEAKEYGLSKELLPNIYALRKHFNLLDTPLRKTQPNWSEAIVRFLTHPMVSPLLLSLGLLGLFFEFRMPGWGVSGTVGLALIALFFWGHYLVGLATWTEIIIFLVGVALLLLEILVIPGFGLAGIAGIIFIFSGLFLSLIKHPFRIPASELSQAVYSLSLTLILTVAGILLLMKLLPRTWLWKRVVLSAREDKEQGYQSHTICQQYIGKKAKTITPLHPSGRALWEGKILEVVSESGFIERDKEITIVSAADNRIVVREAS